MADPSVLKTDRSATLFCESVSVAVLLPGVGSVTPEGGVTVTVLTRLPVNPLGIVTVTV